MLNQYLEYIDDEDDAGIGIDEANDIINIFHDVYAHTARLRQRLRDTAFKYFEHRCHQQNIDIDHAYDVISQGLEQTHRNEIGTIHSIFMGND